MPIKLLWTIVLIICATSLAQSPEVIAPVQSVQTPESSVSEEPTSPDPTAAKQELPAEQKTPPSTEIQIPPPSQEINLNPIKEITEEGFDGKKEKAEQEIKADIPEVTPEQANKYFHETLRRVVIFPIDTQGNYRKEAELAWWKVREILNEYQRFLVATKRFLTQKETFQPRSQLKISDAILLGQILESDCLITTYIQGRSLTMLAYAGQDGMLLWKKSLDFNSSKPIAQQLEESSEKLIRDFIATIPYHGFQIVDPLIGKTVIEEGSTLIAKVDVGAKSTILAGEKVQWIEIERVNTQPLFQGGAKYTVYAEGTVVKNENQILTVEIKRLISLDKLQKKSVILSSEESKRLTSQHALKDSSKPEVPTALVQGELRDSQDHNSEKKSLFTALAAIINIVVVILLAF